MCSENIASLCGSERATILPSYKHMFVADVRAELKSPLPAAPKEAPELVSRIHVKQFLPLLQTGRQSENNMYPCGSVFYQALTSGFFRSQKARADKASQLAYGGDNLLNV